MSPQISLAPSSPAASPGQRVPARTSHWRRPEPHAFLMWLLGHVNRWLVRGYFRVVGIDLPASDLAVLRGAVNRGTAAFLGPNHPEFATDWLIDKSISTMVAPLMASWADRGIVNAAPRFWGMNNLVANDGAEAARAYSVECALRGDAVLLHPEGTVRWTGDTVHPLFPGIAQMAMDAAAASDRPVYIVPIVWKYRYLGDVSPGMHREMLILERGLGSPDMSDATVAARFHALQENVLAMRLRRFEITLADASADFFQRQHEARLQLVELLERRHPTLTADTMDKRIARLVRTIRNQLDALRHEPTSSGALLRAQLRRDLAMAEEAKRLGEFSRETYGGATLTQEHVFESLKRMRDRLLRRSVRDNLAAMLPRPFGPRVVHVGVPDPIRVVAVRGRERSEYESALLEVARASMQARLDAINVSIEPLVAPYRISNPFVRSSHP